MMAFVQNISFPSFALKSIDFQQIFGLKCKPTPGRVNLLGEHTDYNDGFIVLPTAVPQRTTVHLGMSKDGQHHFTLKI